MVGSKGMDLKSQMPRPEPNPNYCSSKIFRSRKDIDPGPYPVGEREQHKKKEKIATDWIYLLIL
jgi:hypothetical protein